MDTKKESSDSNGSGDPLELYSASTPNGIKVAACLEELRSRSVEYVKYEECTVDIHNAGQTTEAYLKLNPNGKIPTIVDPEKGVIQFESGAILLYLAEKYSALLPARAAQRTETICWLMWSSTGLSNQVKQFGFYYKSCQHSIPYCVSRFATEIKRLLAVLERHLSDDRTHIVGGKNSNQILNLRTVLSHFGFCFVDEYTIADISTWPWIHALFHHCGPTAADDVFGGLKDVPHVLQWYERCIARPASQKSLTVCMHVDK